MATGPQRPLFEPARHEPLRGGAWDAGRAREAIARIADDADASFDEARLWPLHPLDADALEPAGSTSTPFYHGAGGIAWALDHLRACGAASPRRDYAAMAELLRERNRPWLARLAAGEDASYLMGDTPFELMAHAKRPSATGVERLAALVERNVAHPAHELMWGAPGTMLAALFMHERLTAGTAGAGASGAGASGAGAGAGTAMAADEATEAAGDADAQAAARFADLFRRSADALWRALAWSEERQCHYLPQSLRGDPATYLDAVHGFVAAALPLIRGRALLGERFAPWRAVIEDTVARTALCAGELANWPPELLRDHRKMLVQFCHGAPGFVVCLRDMPGDALDGLLRAAGETTWTAGPLAKGPNLCHGTAGNGYALLALFARTGDERWLERARAFAAHAIVQVEEAAARHGAHRHSLWTGDLGVAIYLYDCIEGEPRFPMLDVI